MPTSVKEKRKRRPDPRGEGAAGLASRYTHCRGEAKGRLWWKIEVRPGAPGGTKLAAKARPHDIHLRRVGAARLRLDVPHLGEVAFQTVEQGALGAAAQHLGDE